MKLLQDAEWSHWERPRDRAEVQAEVERRIAAGEIVSAAQVKKMKQQAAPTGEWTGRCPSRTPRLPVAPATLCPSRVDRFS
ncbi:MAG: hypothetical protein ACXWP5_11365 [Bdellovibrionota bacterium]